MPDRKTCDDTIDVGEDRRRRQFGAGRALDQRLIDEIADRLVERGDDRRAFDLGQRTGCRRTGSDSGLEVLDGLVVQGLLGRQQIEFGAGRVGTGELSAEVGGELRGRCLPRFGSDLQHSERLHQGAAALDVAGAGDQLAHDLVALAGQSLLELEVIGAGLDGRARVVPQRLDRRLNGHELAASENPIDVGGGDRALGFDVDPCQRLDHLEGYAKLAHAQPDQDPVALVKYVRTELCQRHVVFDPPGDELRLVTGIGRPVQFTRGEPPGSHQGQHGENEQQESHRNTPTTELQVASRVLDPTSRAPVRDHAESSAPIANS